MVEAPLLDTFHFVFLLPSTPNSLLPLAAISSSELAGLFTPYDLKRLELYSRSMVDYHLVMDLIPTVGRIFFLKQLGDVSLSAAQCVSLANFLFVCQVMQQKRSSFTIVLQN